MKLLNLFILILVFSNVALGADAVVFPSKSFTGTVYDLKTKKVELFSYKHEVVIEGDKEKVKNTYFDKEGKELYTESAILINGVPNALEIKQLQIGAEGKFEHKDGKASFSYTIDSKTKSAEEKWAENVAIAPSLIGLLQRNWGKILAGETVKVRYAVIDRRETVGFEFFKVGDAEVEGQKAIQIKMKPSSFLIAAIVDPLLFTFSANGERLLNLAGRTPLKYKNEGGSWKDLDAYTVYKH